MTDLLVRELIAYQTRNGLNDGQMAAKLGCSRQLWQMTRTGVTPVAVTLLKCIARAIPELQPAIMEFLKGERN